MFMIALILPKFANEMTSVSSSRSLSLESPLPPLIRCPKDREFLKAVYRDIYLETGEIDGDKPGLVYLVYKGAFDKLIEYVSAYKPLLTSIKAEYEDVIETVRRGHREANFLQSQIQTFASQPSTLNNYRLRCDELHERLSELRESNERLSKNLHSAKEERCLAEEKKRYVPPTTPAAVVRRHHRPLPGLTVAQMTDREALSRELIRLDTLLRGLQHSEKTKFVPREQKEKLTERLVEKLNQLESTRSFVSTASSREAQLQTAVTACKAFEKSEGNTHGSLEEMVLRSLKDSRKEMTRREESSITSESGAVSEEIPGEEKESGLMLEYLERFQELMKAGDYHRAAQHAANSVRGVLRTMDILQKFREADSEDPSLLVLLTFCEALASTAPEFGGHLPTDLSFEGVLCALDHGRIDLIEHWITNERLSLTEGMGDLLVSYSDSQSHHAVAALDLAQYIFETCISERSSADRINKSVECLVKSGRYRAALDRARGALQPEDLIILLSCYPSPSLALAVLREPGVSWCEVVRKLVDCAASKIIAAILPEWIDICVKKAPKSAISAVIRSIVSETPEFGLDFWSSLLSSSPPSMIHQQEVLACALVQETINASSEHMEQFVASMTSTMEA